MQKKYVRVACVAMLCMAFANYANCQRVPMQMKIRPALEDTLNEVLVTINHPFSAEAPQIAETNNVVSPYIPRKQTASRHARHLMRMPATADNGGAEIHDTPVLKPADDGPSSN